MHKDFKDFLSSARLWSPKRGSAAVGQPCSRALPFVPFVPNSLPRHPGFRTYQTLDSGVGHPRRLPDNLKWVISNKKAEIVHTMNSGPGLAFRFTVCQFERLMRCTFITWNCILFYAITPQYFLILQKRYKVFL